MVFWRCKRCGRLHDYVVFDGEPIATDEWLANVNDGLYGGGNVYADLFCSKCKENVGMIGSSRSVLAGFSFRGDVHFIYFDTLEGAINSNPDRFFIREKREDEPTEDVTEVDLS